jgi:hypothetical protein
MAAPILSGFPTPEALDEYERRIPGFGKILVDEAVKHREALEKAEERAHILAKARLEYEVEIMKRGQICGLAIGIVAILAGCLTAALGGAPFAGGFVGGGGVIGLVAVFLLQNRDTSRVTTSRAVAGRTG